MSTDELSPGGSRIHRHAEVAAGGKDVAHADDERITAHLTRTLGEPANVWHELVSERVHVDVHLVPAAADRPYLTLVTSGMSARPMKVPPDLDEPDQWSLAELCLFLPPVWKIDQEAFADETHYWPVRLLKMLARLPHMFDTWLGWGHSIPNGDPAQPYAPGTRLAGALIIPPFAQPEEFFVVAGAPTLHVFQILPVTAAELDFKLAKGTEALLEKLEARHEDIYGPIDPARASAV